ncbi:MAG: hypothetical protein R3F14_47240 [Polyangiaceae bacterium]
MGSRTRGRRSAKDRTATALGRGVAVSVALGKLACTPPAPPPPPPAPTAVATAAPAPSPTVEVAAPEPPPPVPDPSPLLAPYKLTNDDHLRRVLYTWTTKEQIDELRGTKVLLSRTESPTRGRSYFDVMMDVRWNAGDKFAGLLRAPAFQKARFAWHAPFATLLGWPGESYGTELLQVTLKPEALIAMYRTSSQKWEIQDLAGKTVTEAEAIRRPERIAAVFFVHDAVSIPSTTSPSPSGRSRGYEAYREYVLCNESMIESWSFGTEAIAKELATEADALDAAAAHFERHRPPEQRTDRWNAHVAMLVWPSLVPLEAPKELYEAALAFPNPSYEINPASLRTLAKTLREMKPSGLGLSHTPNMKFPGAHPVPVPPPPPPPPAWKKKWRGTFY